MEDVKKHSISVDSVLYDEVKDYCETNGIKAVGSFISTLIKKGLMDEMYGDTPFAPIKKEAPMVEKKEEIEIDGRVYSKAELIVIIKSYGALLVRSTVNLAEKEAGKEEPLPSTSAQSIDYESNTTIEEEEKKVEPTVKKPVKRRLR